MLGIIKKLGIKAICESMESKKSIDKKELKNNHIFLIFLKSVIFKNYCILSF